MPFDPILFDLPPLYTTPWTAPHSPGPMSRLRTPGWEDMPVGSVVAEGMQLRGITEEHLAVSVRGRSLILDPPPCIGGGDPLVLDTEDPPRDPEPLVHLLDMCTASVARETLMRRAGWTPGAPLSLWMLMTTPIGEAVLSIAESDPFEAWSATSENRSGVAVHCRRNGYMVACHRLGPTLLISTAEVAPGLMLRQGDQTTLVAHDRADMARAATLERGMRVGDAFDVSASPIADVVANLIVWNVTVRPDEGARIDLDMPVVSMAPMPAVLRDAFVGCEVSDADLSFPLWALACEIDGPAGRVAIRN